ncbi:potassium:proton antiporter [Rhizobium acidisoli]|uniref:Potassium:proton antiporter n=2 Tax=Rhizobium TaxID=379 RepID=A0AAE5TXE0_9HYPH|nr:MULTISPECIES: cation:proton antiporter [Rhizobium]KPH06155.1 potassium:proton antiporter [Rhizobium acidisoli]MBB6222319.1 CPA2 family monovalent cation:H+ antiporter-2 [Rhizobium leguminosarum]QAS78450.1 potassium:proton antiporter [Rhizobium acidisoli]
MTEHLLTQSLSMIMVSAIAVWLFAALRMPAAMGYLLAGLAIGPYGLNLVAISDDTLFLAELGLIFLMFMVGLEFSLTTLLAARTDVLLAGSLQVGGTLVAIAAALWSLGLDPRIAILLGGAVAMSSTAVAMSQLAEQGEISSQHGRFAIGILLFQDIATIPLLVAVDSWSRQAPVDPVHLLGRLGLAAIAIVAVSIIARPLVRNVLANASRSRSNDSFLLAALFVALGAAYLAHLAGLALPIGAFIAGMVIGGSDFKHRVEDDLRPFRDVLVGLFFVTVGMQIDLGLILVSPYAIFAWCTLFLFGKALITFIVGLMLRRTAAIALRVAVILAHGGEFGLLLLTLAMNTGLLPSEIGQPVLIALALTMGLAPLLIQRGALVEHIVGNRRARVAATETAIRTTSASLNQHVVLCGCGRVGRLVATAFEAAKIPHIAIESDLARFKEAQRQGHAIVHGDAAHRRILSAAGLAKARLIVITFDRHSAVERILKFAGEQQTAIPCFVSTADNQDITSLVKAGAKVVFPENLAAGLALADQSLLLCGLTREEAGRIITSLRAELNPDLRERVGV